MMRLHGMPCPLSTRSTRYDVDVEHGILRKEILKKYADTQELQEDCINAQLMKNNMRRVMADCIYITYVVQGLKVTDSDSCVAGAPDSFPLN